MRGSVAPKPRAVFSQLIEDIVYTIETWEFQAILSILQSYEASDALFCAESLESQQRVVVAVYQVLAVVRAQSLTRGEGIP
jgi:hypothetical protein